MTAAFVAGRSPEIRLSPRSAWVRSAIFLLLPLAAGCATFSDGLAPIERSLAAQRPAEALAALEQQQPRDPVLYHLNKGMILRIKGDFAESNQALEVAKGLIRALYATSISEQALSFVVNDATRSYIGEEYEQILLNVYKAINYLELGAADDARVEVLQADVKMREFSERVTASSLSDDAFGRYLAGMIFEQLGEWSDALISYRKAYEAYKTQKVHARIGVPEPLRHDLLRLTKRQGLGEEHERYRQEFGMTDQAEAGPSGDAGEFILVLSNGLAPILREQSHAMVDMATQTGVRISLPFYQSRPAVLARAELTSGGTTARSAVMADIDAVARESLTAKMPAIVARAIARQVVKVQAARKTQQAVQRRSGRSEEGVLAGAIAGLAMTAVNVATERADTRSWTTLPREVQLARLRLPPGRHDVQVQFKDANGSNVGTHTFPGVEVRAGVRRFVSLHWMPVQLPTTRR